jgi:hypothetical protein
MSVRVGLCLNLFSQKATASAKGEHTETAYDRGMQSKVVLLNKLIEAIANLYDSFVFYHPEFAYLH